MGVLVTALITSMLVGLPGVWVSLVVALLAIEIDRSGRYVAVPVVKLASLILPRSARREWADQWVDHVLCDAEDGIRPMLSAFSIATFAAPKLAMSLRLRPIAGRYLYALLSVTLDVMVGSGKRRHRKSPIPFAKASLRLSALWMVPLLALGGMRWRRGVPRWAVYVLGTGSTWVIPNLWFSWLSLPGVVLALAVQGVLTVAAGLLIANEEGVIEIAARLITPRAE
jgi:hypothetical protein